MKPPISILAWNLGAGMVGLVLIGSAKAQTPPQFSSFSRPTNGEFRLQMTAPAGSKYRIDTSTNLPDWTSLLTLQSAGANSYTDSAAPFAATRYYRAVQVTNVDVLTGDHLITTNGDVIIHPVNHAGFVMKWNDTWIYSDPVSGTFSGIPKANLVLLTHNHSDHFNNTVLAGIWNSAHCIFIAPQLVYSNMSAAFKAVTIVLTNGASTNVLGLRVDAIPAYNSNHPQGSGNGYVLTIGGGRIFVSGDTGDIPDIRALQNIDVAFLCMNVPFTMPVNDAASVVRAFRPRAVYPYHYRNLDNTLANLASFKQQVGTDLGIEVRLRNWY